MRRPSVSALALLRLVAAAIGLRAEDAYPTPPIRVLVPHAPGGATDIVAGEMSNWRKISGEVKIEISD
jgi:tripartite-type tricarboxylate transporter receptor subunit TctC